MSVWAEGQMANGGIADRLFPELIREDAVAEATLRRGAYANTTENFFQIQHPLEEEYYSYPCSLSNFELKEAVRKQLEQLGFSKNGNGYAIEGQLTKQRIRDFHSRKRIEVLRNNKSFIEGTYRVAREFYDPYRPGPEGLCP